MRSLFVLVLLHFAVISKAQQEVRGSVKDSSEKGLAYATIELFKSADGSRPIKSVYTNEKGNYKFEKVDTGTYYVIISHTGFSESRLPFSVTDKAVELPVMNLKGNSGTLSAVTVTARKPLVEQSDDKIIYNVESDPAAKTENAIDLLRKTPFVSVDGEDNIQVNGQTNFRVLLNGRETAMFANNIKEALKGFPGALITKIEVITSPSAKYDAEGVGGVINIITKKKVVGYNGNLNVFYNAIGWYNANTNFSAKWGKFGMTMNYGFNTGVDIPGRTVASTIPKIPSEFSSRILSGKRVMNNFWNWGNLELNYEIDSLNTISTYGNISGGKNSVVFNQTITTDYTSGEDSVSNYDLLSRNAHPTMSVGADFIRKFSSNKEREFSLRLNGEFGNSNTYLNSVMDNEMRPDNYVINNSEATNKQYTIQTDYIHPMKNSWKLEVGLKGIFRKAKSDFESFTRANTIEEYKANPSNTDQFSYNQDVLSAYSSLGFKTGKTSFRLGARLEHTDINGSFQNSSRTVEQQYTNLLPNIQSTTKFSNAFTVVLTYSDRIQRPFIQQLNPFRNNNDPKNIFFGNPDLQPQVIHSLALQTRVSMGATFASLTFTGSYSDNMIVQYASFDPATGITSNTSGNVGEEKGFNVAGNTNVRVSNKLSIFLNGYLRFSHIRNKMMTSQVNSGWGGNANMNANYSFSKRFNMSGYAGFFQNAISLQTRYPLNLWYGLNMGYKMLNEKLTLSAGLSNFFQKERDWVLETIDPNFTYTSRSTMPFRTLSLSLNWSFGKLSENTSKKKGVNNDDLLSTGSSN